MWHKSPKKWHKIECAGQILRQVLQKAYRTLFSRSICWVLRVVEYT